MPVHISTQQPTKPNKEEELQDRINELEEQNKALYSANYVSSLGDDKSFRLELIREIRGISEAINSLTEKVIELTSQSESPQ